MSEKRFTVMKKFDGSYVICDKGKMLVADDCCDLLNEQQDKITELEIELTDCKNRKEQSEYKNTKLIAKIDFLERIIDGDL